MEEAQKHPWFNTLNVYKPTTISDSILSSMQEFQSYNHLKKAALTAVAYHLNDVGNDDDNDDDFDWMGN